jgi:hypothetical protein
MELMIGFINSPGLPLSGITAASLADMGYVVDELAGDPYTLPGFAAHPPAEEAGIRLLDDVIVAPVISIDESGRAVRTIIPPGGG